MAVDSFYEESLQRKLEDIQARRLQIQSNLAISKRDGDHYDAGDEIAQIAHLDDQAASLVRLYQRSVAESTPPQPRQRQSIMNSNKPIEDYTIEDQLEIVNHERTHKLTADDLHQAIRDNQN